MVLVDDGRIVAERYVGIDPSSRREIASCQKSVVSVLVGIAQRRGLLAVDDVVSDHLGPGWTHAAAEQEAQITIRHLLSMTSGLDAERRVVAAPGTVWSYNNDAYHQLQPVLEAVTAAAHRHHLHGLAVAPIGATGSTWARRRGQGRYARDAKGAPLWGLTMTARDMARFGLLVQREPLWGGAPVLDDADYLQASLRSSSEANPSYGYLWWLNGAASFASARMARPSRDRSSLAHPPTWWRRSARTIRRSTSAAPSASSSCARASAPACEHRVALRLRCRALAAGARRPRPLIRPP